MGFDVVINCQPLHQSSCFVKIERKSSSGRVFDQRKAFLGSQLLGVARLESLIQSVVLAYGQKDPKIQKKISKKAKRKN